MLEKACSGCYKVTWLAIYLLSVDSIVSRSSLRERNGNQYHFTCREIRKCRERKWMGIARAFRHSMDHRSLQARRYGRHIHDLTIFRVADQITAELLHRVESRNFTFVRSCMQNVTCHVTRLSRMEHGGGRGLVYTRGREVCIEFNNVEEWVASTAILSDSRALKRTR